MTSKTKILAALLSLSGAAAHAEVKVGIINIPRAISETQQGKSVKDQLEKELADKRKKMETEQTSLQKLQEEFQKKAMVMSEQARAEKGQELQKKYLALQEMAQRSEQELQQKQAELTKPIVEGLRTLIPEISRKRTLDVVLDQTAVLYALNVTDVTEELIKAYDEKNPKAAKKK